MLKGTQENRFGFTKEQGAKIEELENTFESAGIDVDLQSTLNRLIAVDWDKLSKKISDIPFVKEEWFGIWEPEDQI